MQALEAFMERQERGRENMRRKNEVKKLRLVICFPIITW